MPSAVFVSSKPCSMAHRTPLSHTNRRNGVLSGALLRSYHYVGSAPRGRLSTSHTVRSGSPALLSVTRLRANAYAIGPLVPSETVRRYQHEDARLCAKVSTVTGACVSAATRRLARTSPLYVEVLSVVSGRWSQQRVSADIDTNDVTPRQLSTASRKSGLFP